MICYILELEGIEERTLSLEAKMSSPQTERRANLEIYFDVAYNQQASRSASGLVVKDMGVES